MQNQITEQLLGTLAGRYEHYSDFGSTFNGKLSFMEKVNILKMHSKRVMVVDGGAA